MEGAKTAPVDAAGSCHLAGTVYGGRILPLPAKRHPQQQRHHLQRPAQIAEIMHFPPRPDLSDGPRTYIIEQARLLRQKTENRYLAVLVAAWGVNRCRKALFGVASRPDTPTAVLGGETVEH